jgi:hypothetical protein
MKLHNFNMNEPDWEAFITSIAGVDSKSRKKFVADQSVFIGTREYFGGVPADWFRTFAGGMLQELISKCENNKQLVARRAGMSATNLYSILDGKHDPKLGTLIRIIHANGFELKFDLVKRTSN